VAVCVVFSETRLMIANNLLLWASFGEERCKCVTEREPVISLAKTGLSVNPLASIKLPLKENSPRRLQ
jgi:hypothetical protein